jgi:hypothetical protein
MNKGNLQLWMFICAFFGGLSACSEYTPKPKGFPRIEFPEKAYALFDGPAPFSFSIPVYSQMLPDSDFNSEPHWYNLHFPDFDATLHLSYKELRSEQDLDSLIDIADKAIENMDNIFENSNLPNKVSKDLVDTLLITIRKEFYNLPVLATNF